MPGTCKGSQNATTRKFAECLTRGRRSFTFPTIFRNYRPICMRSSRRVANLARTEQVNTRVIKTSAPAQA